MLILLYILIVILKAVSDGLNDSGFKGWGHAVNSLWIGALFIIPNFVFLLSWYIQIISFTLLMIALFDYTYNLTRGLKISFVGTTSWWDQAIAKVPFGFMLFVRLIALIVGIFLILNQ